MQELALQPKAAPKKELAPVEVKPLAKDDTKKASPSDQGQGHDGKEADDSEDDSTWKDQEETSEEEDMTSDEEQDEDSEVPAEQEMSDHGQSPSVHQTSPGPEKEEMEEEAAHTKKEIFGDQPKDDFEDEDRVAMVPCERLHTFLVMYVATAMHATARATRRKSYAFDHGQNTRTRPCPISLHMFSGLFDL